MHALVCDFQRLSETPQSAITGPMKDADVLTEEDESDQEQEEVDGRQDRGSGDRVQSILLSSSGSAVESLEVVGLSRVIGEERESDQPENHK